MIKDSTAKPQFVLCYSYMPEISWDTQVRIIRAFQSQDEMSQAYEEILLGAMLQRVFTLGVKSRSLYPSILDVSRSN